MFYRLKNNKIYDYADYKYEEDCLEFKGLTQEEYLLTPNKVIVKDNELVLNPDFEKEEEEKEKERILTLSMTRSDFFDGTIKAFGADEEDLLPSIQLVLSTMEMEEIEKKIALNNFKNALNFYRKHPLFNILSNIPLQIGDIIVKITAKQWDKFFNETSKGNKDAWKEIIPNEIIEVGKEEEAPVINTEEVGEQIDEF